MKHFVPLGALALALTVPAAGQGLGAVTHSPPPPGLKEGQGAGFAKGHFAALDKLPDWGGIWFVELGGPPGQTQMPKPKLKGKYLKDYEAYVAEVKANSGVLKSEKSHCAPPGMPGIMELFQYPFEFLFTPGRVTINQEAWMQTRTIWTDGRTHQDDPDPTYMGDSIGHWEGDTLVADTIAIDDSLELARGMGHSDKFHITERIHLDPKDPDTLLDEMVLEDPEALEEPYHLTVRYGRDRNGHLLEFECSQNDRNQVEANGDTKPF